MKRIVLAAFTFALIGMSNAQVTTPQPSTGSQMEQTVGLTKVSVSYSRPSVKGRTIFGDLVPFDKVWRTGANKNTMVTFSDAVTINGTKVPAGDYALYTKPMKNAWEVYLYSDTKNWGTPEKWDDSKVVVRTKVEAKSTGMPIELFTILVNNTSDNDGEILLLWEKTMVSIPFSVPTAEKAMESIKKTLAGDNVKASDYYSAASYYYSSDNDISKAKQWIDKALEMSKEQPPFWYLRKQALITAKTGDKKAAIEIAKHSMELAKEAKNMDYVNSNKASIAEWSK